MRLYLSVLLVALIVIPSAALAVNGNGPVAPNGIGLFKDYRMWQVIAPSYREDKQQIRLILGNPIAVQAMRNKVRPMPDGAVLCKIAWSAKKHPQFPVATVPENFAQVEFMVKDSARYKATGGWGFARFVGPKYQPYGKDASFVQECFGCHTPVKGNDYLFTGYAAVP
ncbi:cytochrome P460 [Geomonas sp. Red276]